MSGQLAIRKSLVAGLNFDGALGEDFIFKGNMVSIGYSDVDITDALVSKGMQYAIGRIEQGVRAAAKRAGVKADEYQMKVMIEAMSEWICIGYSMGEQHGVATGREMAAQGARGYIAEQVEVVEDEK